MKRKTSQISVRLGEDLLHRIDKASGVVGMDISSITKACLEAFCDEVEEKEGIWLPLKISSKKNENSPTTRAATAASDRRTYSTLKHAEKGIALIAEDPPTEAPRHGGASLKR